MTGILLAICLVIAPVLASAATEGSRTADHVLTNGKIITVDADFRISEAIAIRGDTIVAVGSNDEIRAYASSDTRVTDLDGKSVIPGLIDSHVHFIRASRFWDMEARLDGVQRHSAALTILRDKSLSANDGDWVLCIGGWIEDQFEDEKRGFTREELDEVAPDNPVFLQVDYSHAYVNTFALQKLGIAVDRAGADESSGAAERGPGSTGSAIKIEREQGGIATGRIDGIAALLKFRGDIYQDRGDAESLASTRAMVTDFNRVGITAIYDLGGVGTVPAAYKPARELADRGELTLRVRHGMWMTPRSKEDVIAQISRIKRNAPFGGNDFLSQISIGELVVFPLTDNVAKPFRKDDGLLQDFQDILSAAAEGDWTAHVHVHYADSMFLFLDKIEKIIKKKRSDI